MIAVFVCTHGAAAGELVRSAELICGVQENVGTTYFQAGEAAEELTVRIKRELAQLHTGDGILLLTDLKGGTPFNVLAREFLALQPAELLTGVNVPMLLETFLSRELLALPKLAKQAVASGAAGIYRYEASVLEAEEDF